MEKLPDGAGAQTVLYSVHPPLKGQCHEIFESQGAPPESTKPAVNMPPVPLLSLIPPFANLSPLSSTPLVNLPQVVNNRNNIRLLTP